MFHVNELFGYLNSTWFFHNRTLQNNLETKSEHEKTGILFLNMKQSVKLPWQMEGIDTRVGPDLG